MELEKTQTEIKKPAQKGKWFRKIPKEFLFSPGGIILIFLAGFFEILDWFIPGGSLTFEIIPDLIFACFLKVIAGIPFQATVFPFLIERIPVLSDILPSWLLKIFGLF